VDFTAIHCAMVRGCDALALKHPENALLYHAIPWVLDAVFLAYFALTLWFGLRVQCEMLGMVIEARFSPRGELLHYEPVRYGESIATIGPKTRA
jgi:hypothetical protein